MAIKDTHRYIGLKYRQLNTNQENFFESLENLSHHLPHLRNQFKDPEWTETTQHHQKLSS